VQESEGGEIPAKVKDKAKFGKRMRVWTAGKVSFVWVFSVPSERLCEYMM